MSVASIQNPVLDTQISPRLQPADGWIQATAIVDQNAERPVGQQIFVCRLMLATLDSIEQGRYSDLDPLTTSNCCHGASVYAVQLIQDASNYELPRLKQLVDSELTRLLDLPSTVRETESSVRLPEVVIRLAELKALNLIRDNDLLRGSRTNSGQLKRVATLSTSFCTKLVKSLQARVSNRVAEGYPALVSGIDERTLISGVPLRSWKKYVDEPFIRKAGDLKYVSNLFSMQVCLAHLLHRSRFLVILNDVKDGSGNLKRRDIRVFQGDPASNRFTDITDEVERTRAIANRQLPVVVFAGCSHCASDEEVEAVIMRMRLWRDDITRLMLACDVGHPQFPSGQIRDSSPIKPDEPTLTRCIEEHGQVTGVTSSDPSFFFLAHIFPASLGQVFDSQDPQAGVGFPVTTIPGKAVQEGS